MAGAAEHKAFYTVLQLPVFFTVVSLPLSKRLFSTWPLAEVNEGWLTLGTTGVAIVLLEYKIYKQHLKYTIQVYAMQIVYTT